MFVVRVQAAVVLMPLMQHRPRVDHSRLDVRSEFLKQQQPVGDYLIRATMQQTHPYSHNSNVQIPL